MAAPRPRNFQMMLNNMMLLILNDRLLAYMKHRIIYLKMDTKIAKTGNTDRQLGRLRLRLKSVSMKGPRMNRHQVNSCKIRTVLSIGNNLIKTFIYI